MIHHLHKKHPHREQSDVKLPAKEKMSTISTQMSLTLIQYLEDGKVEA